MSAVIHLFRSHLGGPKMICGKRDDRGELRATMRREDATCKTCCRVWGHWNPKDSTEAPEALVVALGTAEDGASLAPQAPTPESETP